MSQDSSSDNCGFSYVAPNASVVGDVDLVDMTTVWYGAVLRGDQNSIHVSTFEKFKHKITYLF